jgi:hypothetical protein
VNLHISNPTYKHVTLFPEGMLTWYSEVLLYIVVSEDGVEYHGTG